MHVPLFLPSLAPHRRRTTAPARLPRLGRSPVRFRSLYGRVAALLLLVAIAPSDASAQGLLGRARRAASRAAGAVVDRTADAAAQRAGAAAEGAIGTDPATADDAGAPAPSEADLAAYAASAPTGGVLFATDFSADAPGDFPAGFTLGSGTFEVAAIRGRRVLRATAFGEIHVELPDDLPETFTLEFELSAPMGWTQEVHFQNSARTYVHLAPDRGGLGGRQSAVSQPSSNPGGHRFFPVRIVVDGERVKVYHSRTLVANVPEADLGRSNRLTFKMSASQADPVLLASVRLTSGSATSTGGNPNYPGPTTGGSGSGPSGHGPAPVHGGHFEARSVGAMDVDLAGPATYERIDYDQVDLYTITLRSEVDPEHYVELSLQTDAPEVASYAVYVRARQRGDTGPDPDRPSHVAGARARVGVGSAVRTFQAGGGYVMLDEVSPGRLRGRFQFTGTTGAGEGATFSGTFDARQPLVEPAPTPSRPAPPAPSVLSEADLLRLADAVEAREGVRPVVQPLQAGTLTVGRLEAGDHPRALGGYVDLYAFRLTEPMTLVAAVMMFDVYHQAALTITDADLQPVVESGMRENGDAETLPRRLEPGLYLLRVDINRSDKDYNLYLFDPALPLPMP